jgi:predicted transcriptional regulator
MRNAVRQFIENENKTMDMSKIIGGLSDADVGSMILTSDDVVTGVMTYKEIQE